MDRYQTRKKTKIKRQSQTCKVFEIKIDNSHLSKNTIKHLNSLFVEAKWFYNYCLALDDVNEADTKAKLVPVKVENEFENRTFSALTAQMKQSIKTRLFNSMSSLKALKRKGHRIGKLKFKSLINSIPLKQYEKTFYLDKEKSRVRIQGMKNWMRANGLEQISDNVDIACSALVRKGDDFFLHITTFESRKEKEVPNSSIGIDFGCETQLAFSDGTKIKFQVPISQRLRRLDRKIMRKSRKRSNNKRKDQLKRYKEYQHLTNKKRDIRHKVVSAITKNFKYVCFQDESIHEWSSRGHGKKIQNSAIGGIIADLKHKSHTPLEVDKFFPSTQLCPSCGERNKLELNDRVYECDCGYVCDRDIKSALCIKVEGLKKIPMDHREFTLEENCSSAFFDAVNNIHSVEVSKADSLNQEAAGLAPQ